MKVIVTGNTRYFELLNSQPSSCVEGRRQKHLDLVLKHFWNRWRGECLAELCEHHLGRKTAQSRVIKQGVVVYVHEDKVPRQRWELVQ